MTSKPWCFMPAALLVLAACSGGSSLTPHAQTTAPPNVVHSYAFPAGDASATTGAIAWDITGVTTTLSGDSGSAGGNAYDKLTVAIAFTQNIASALPAAGTQLSSGTQLGVHVGLDVDGSATTGFYSTCSAQSSLKPFEYETDQGNAPNRLADGNYAILGANGPTESGATDPASEAVTSVAGNTMTMTFFLPAVDVFSGSAIPRVGVAVAAFNGSSQGGFGSPPTDCVPASGEIFTN